MNNLITVIVPTKNRPLDLLKAIDSIYLQTRLPDECIIIDQSVIAESYDSIFDLSLSFNSIRLDYVCDTNINGLVEAKEVGVRRSSGNIILFLEDDIVLSRDYIEQIENGFSSNPNMMGCCGVITNEPYRNLLYKFLFTLFHRGIYRDVRFGITGKYLNKKTPFIQSNMLSGGTSAWRRDVFNRISFDTCNGFHMYEDIDFSTRVYVAYHGQLYINTNARLEHYWSPINRQILGLKQAQKIKESITYYKKRKNWPFALPSLIWLLCGLFFESLVQSSFAHSFDSILGYFIGLRDGLNRRLSD